MGQSMCTATAFPATLTLMARARQSIVMREAWRPGCLMRWYGSGCLTKLRRDPLVHL